MESEEKKTTWTQIKILFSRDIVLPFVVTLMLNFIQELSASSFFGCYSTDFQDVLVGKGEIDGPFWTIIGGVVQLVGAFLTVLTIESVGRLPQILGGEVMNIIGFIMLAVAANFKLKILGIIGFNVWSFANVLPQTAFYAYMTDTVPPMAIGIGFTMQYALRMLTNNMYPHLMGWCSSFQIMIGFAVITFIFLVFFWITMFETKGMSKIEIFESYIVLRDRLAKFWCCSGNSKIESIETPNEEFENVLPNTQTGGSLLQNNNNAKNFISTIDDSKDSKDSKKKN